MTAALNLPTETIGSEMSIGVRYSVIFLVFAKGKILPQKNFRGLTAAIYNSDTLNIWKSLTVFTILAP